MPGDQTGESALFMIEDGHVQAHLQIEYQGDPNSFAWIAPVLGRPPSIRGVAYPGSAPAGHHSEMSKPQTSPDQARSSPFRRKLTMHSTSSDDLSWAKIDP